MFLVLLETRLTKLWLIGRPNFLFIVGPAISLELDSHGNMERRLVPSLSGSKFGPIDHSYNPVSPASRQNKKQACEMRAFPKYHAAEKDSVAGTKSKANVIHVGILT